MGYVYYMDAGHDERLKKNSTIPNFDYNDRVLHAL